MLNFTKINSPIGISEERIFRPVQVIQSQHRRRANFPFGGLQAMCIGVDALAIVIASLAGSAPYQLMISGRFSEAREYLGAGITAALLFVLTSHAAGAYQFSRILSGRYDFSSVFSKWVTVTLTLSMLAFLLKAGSAFSRVSVVCSALLALGLLFASRWAQRRGIWRALNSGFVQGRKVIVVGSDDELARLDANRLLREFGLTEVSRIELEVSRVNSSIISPAEDEAISNTLEKARDQQAAGIVLALSWADTMKLELLGHRLRESPLPVTLLPDHKVRSLAGRSVLKVAPSLAIEIQRGPLTRTEQFLKRAIDIFGGAMALLLLSPLMLITAAAIKLDSSGPVLFRQHRRGFNSREFIIFKFRTMDVLEDGDVIHQATRADTRITRIGRLLRRTSIDEIPQIMNVLRGDMSLVGPRPHATAHDHEFKQILADYALRHHVKPGITGWAQCNGHRGETRNLDQMRRRLEADLWYINNWSLMLDLRIMVKTLWSLPGQNAF